MITIIGLGHPSFARRQRFVVADPINNFATTTKRVGNPLRKIVCSFDPTATMKDGICCCATAHPLHGLSRWVDKRTGFTDRTRGWSLGLWLFRLWLDWLCILWWFYLRFEDQILRETSWVSKTKSFVFRVSARLN